MLDDPGLLGKARARVEAAHRLSPADLPIALELSRFRQETGDGPGAEEILLAARRLAPNDLRLEARLADVYLRQGRSAEAARALWRARSVNQSLARSLGQLTAALELTQADRGIGLLRDWADDDLREALRVANETAVRLHAARQPEAQGRVLGLIVELDPSDTCAAMSLAEQALKSRQRDRARTMLARIVASAPGPGDKNARCHRRAIENFVALELADRRYAEVDGLRNQIQERPWRWCASCSAMSRSRKDPAAAMRPCNRPAPTLDRWDLLVAWANSTRARVRPKPPRTTRCAAADPEPRIGPLCAAWRIWTALGSLNRREFATG